MWCGRAVISLFLFADSSLRFGAFCCCKSALPRFHIPLIKPDVQISRIRLSDKTSRLLTPSCAQTYESEVPVQVREWIAGATSLAPARFCFGRRAHVQAHQHEFLLHPGAQGTTARAVSSVLKRVPHADPRAAGFGKFKRSVSADAWPMAAKAAAQIHALLIANFVLGWLAIAAVRLVR